MLPQTTHAQGSIAYYPWSGLLSFSTNPRKPLWLDTRVQTNSLFSSLSVDLLPLINLKRGEVAQWYLGGGLRVNPLYRIADPKAKLLTVDGYSINFGVRAAPFSQNRQIQVALELNPYVKDDFASGVLKSHFGVVYVFRKREKQQLTSSPAYSPSPAAARLSTERPFPAFFSASKPPDFYFR